MSISSAQAHNVNPILDIKAGSTPSVYHRFLHRAVSMDLNFTLPATLTPTHNPKIGSNKPNSNVPNPNPNSKAGYMP